MNLTSFHALLISAIAILFHNIQCYADDSSKDFDWITMQSWLATPETKTIDDLRERIKKSGIAKDDRELMVDHLDGKPDDVDEHIKYYYGKSEGVVKLGGDKNEENAKAGKRAPDSMRKEASDNIVWKNHKPDLDSATHVYMMIGFYGGDVESPQFVSNFWFWLFTDDHGKILGWHHTARPEQYVPIIINGQRNVVAGNVAWSGTIAVLYNRQNKIRNDAVLSYIIKYSDGPKKNRQGILKDESIELSPGMIFSVEARNK